MGTQGKHFKKVVPPNAEFPDGKMENPETGREINGKTAFKKNPSNFYKLTCRYKQNRTKKILNDEGMIIWKKVEADEAKVYTYMIHKNEICQGAKALWGVYWLQRTNEKLLNAGKDNALMIISMKIATGGKEDSSAIVDEQEQIESIIENA